VPIRRIVLTHAHMDHVGSVDALVEKLASANLELVTNARSVPLLQKPPNTSLEPNEPQGKIKGCISRPGGKTFSTARQRKPKHTCRRCSPVGASPPCGI